MGVLFSSSRSSSLENNVDESDSVSSSSISSTVLTLEEQYEELAKLITENFGTNCCMKVDYEAQEEFKVDLLQQYLTGLIVFQPENGLDGIHPGNGPDEIQSEHTIIVRKNNGKTVSMQDITISHQEISFGEQKNYFINS